MDDFESRLKQGEKLADEEKFDECVSLCDSLLGERPDSAAALSLKGWCLSRQGRKTQALGAYGLAVKHLPTYPLLRKHLAQTLAELGRIEDAEREYGQALRLDPEDAEALLGRGTCRLGTGKPQEGVRDLRAAVEKDPALRERAEETCRVYAEGCGIRLDLKG